MQKLFTRVFGSSPDQQRTRLAYCFAGIAALVVIFLWGTTVYIGRQDWYAPDLVNRGTFGDSFGVINALFSGLAIVGIILAFYLQREQLLEQRNEIRDNKKKDNEDAIEARFFQLITALQNAVNTTRVGEEGKGYVGRQALRKIAYTLSYEQKGNRKHLKAGSHLSADDRRADIDQWFTTFYKGTFEPDGKESTVPWGDLVGHIFRLTFHILKFIEASKDIEEKEFYIRILRAQLSNPELVLLFYNCLSHYGYKEHFDLVERYQMLKNMNLDSLPDRDDANLYTTALGKDPNPLS